jgi:hypothetical protein
VICFTQFSAVNVAQKSLVLLHFTYISSILDGFHLFIVVQCILCSVVVAAGRMLISNVEICSTILITSCRKVLTLCDVLTGCDGGKLNLWNRFQEHTILG